jgi:hypothetical protein
MRRFQIPVVAAAALTVAMLAAATAVAVSADSTSPTPAPQAGPAPSGLESLMPPPDIQQGNAPTLEERYPVLAYTNFDAVAVVAVPVIGVVADPNATAANALANWWAGQLMVFVAAIAIATIRLVEWVFAFDLASGAGAPLTAVVQALHDQVFVPLLPVALALLGVGLVWLMLARRRAVQGLQGAGWAVATLALAAIYFAAPAAVLGAVDGFTGDLSRGILSAIGTGDPDLAARSANPSFSQGDPADAELRMFADRYWRTFVFEPWSVATFGDPVTGQRYGEELLAKQSNMPSNFDTDFNGGATDQAKTWFSGAYGGYRLIIVVLALAAVVLASVLCLVVAGTVLMAQLALALLAMVLPLFLLVGIHPGVGRRILIRVAELAAGALLIRVLSSAFLALLLVLSGLLDQTVSAVNGGWLMAAALQVLLLVAAFAYRKPFLRVFGQVAAPRLTARPSNGPSIGRTAHAGLDTVGQHLQQRSRQAARPPAAGAARVAGKAAAQRGAAAAATSTAAAASRVNPAGLALLAVETGKAGVRWASRTAQGSAAAFAVGGSGSTPRTSFSGAGWRRLPLTRPAPPPAPAPAPAKAAPNGHQAKPPQPPVRQPKLPAGRTYTHHTSGETVSLTSKRIILTGRWREAKP